GHPLHAVGAALPLERPERARALHGKGDLLVAAAVAVARAELLDLESALLGVARQHPVEIAGPEARLVAADALPDLDDRVLVVVGIRGDERFAQRRLELRDARLELGNELLQVAVGPRFLQVPA